MARDLHFMSTGSGALLRVVSGARPLTLAAGWIVGDVPEEVDPDHVLDQLRKVVVLPVIGGVVAVPWQAIATAGQGTIVRGTPIPRHT